MTRLEPPGSGFGGAGCALAFFFAIERTMDCQKWQEILLISER